MLADHRQARESESPEAEHGRSGRSFPTREHVEQAVAEESAEQAQNGKAPRRWLPRT
jgi:hypothetical protein